MSHTAHLQKLMGRTITRIVHLEGPYDDPSREMVHVEFDDGTAFQVKSLCPYSLNFMIHEAPAHSSPPPVDLAGYFKR